MDPRELDLLEEILNYFDNSSGVLTLAGHNVLNGTVCVIEIPENLECLLEELRERVEDET